MDAPTKDESTHLARCQSLRARDKIATSLHISDRGIVGINRAPRPPRQNMRPTKSPHPRPNTHWSVSRMRIMMNYESFTEHHDASASSNKSTCSTHLRLTSHLGIISHLSGDDWINRPTSTD
ncbi:unnamed protein product [Microthlaspi erraticum]|uniref:Uncharacterized protein n=1 Tax=Microthlaspi erraticum TaxID=1685480 RepID=A0A6D2JXE2_9BRAS|nr:unnamed protein product [Microthlaspi erraticum]